MPVKDKIERVTFAGGELGEALGSRADLAKYQIAVEKQENFVTLVEGGVTRAPGTKFVLEVKNSAQRGRLLPFRYSSSDYYMLVVNGGAARFVRQGGFIQNPDTTPYELAVPWAETDLGGLRAAQSANKMYVVTPAVKPQELTRNDHTDWTVADYAPESGPVDTENTDIAKTVRASAATGNIALTGVGDPFTAAMVGGIIKIGNRDLSLTPEWSATETAIALNQERRWNGNVYRALVAGADAGANAPVHTEGDVSAGSGKQTWRWVHSDFGYVRVTGYSNGNSVSAMVLKELPASVVSGATYRWSPPAWSSEFGWPSWVAFVSPRLAFFRGDSAWMTAVDDLHDFNLGLADDDNAIAVRLRAPDASVVEIKWALPSGVLVLGTSDLEWVMRGSGVFDPLTPKGARPFPETSHGSEAHVPVMVDGGVMWIGKTGKRFHFGKYDRQRGELTVQELSVMAKHVFAPGIAGMAWQRDPNRVLWMALADGTLASLTFMPEQEVAAFARHPRTNFFVEDVACVPSVSSGVDEVYMIVRRTINGVTRRYVELLADYFQPGDRDNPTADGAWFVDCGLRAQGQQMTTVSQLAHLEGQTVAICADGAMQNNKVVTGGAITLDRSANDVVVGLPISAYLRDLPRNFQGTSGKKKASREVDVHVLHCAGGKVRAWSPEGAVDETWENVVETGGEAYGAPPAMRTRKVRVGIDGVIGDEVQIELLCDDAMPFTLLGLSPSVEIEEDG